MQIFNKEEIENKVIEKLKNILDLELSISIYDLGIIYSINAELIDEKIYVSIEMTSINSRCNSTKSFTDKIIKDIENIPEVDTCIIKFVFSPKWEVTMISEVGLEKLRNSNS